jgi:hypothetical protein
MRVKPRSRHDSKQQLFRGNEILLSTGLDGRQGRDLSTSIADHFDAARTVDSFDHTILRLRAMFQISVALILILMLAGFAPGFMARSNASVAQCNAALRKLRVLPHRSHGLSPKAKRKR